MKELKNLSFHAAILRAYSHEINTSLAAASWVKKVVGGARSCYFPTDEIITTPLVIGAGSNFVSAV